MTTLVVAKKWLDRGIATVPIIRGTKRCPVKWKQYQSRLPTMPELVKWYAKNDYQLAVVCGWKNLTILDFDRLPAYIRFAAEYPQFRDTLTIRTARGIHTYVYCANASTRMSEDVDVKSNGYCLTYPSVHPNGKMYTVYNDAEIMHVDSLPDSVESPPSIGGTQRSVTLNNYGSIGTLNITLNNKILGESPHAGSDLISRIKSRVPITTLFTDYRPSGNGMAMANCPMPAHSNGDKNPSLSLDLRTNRFNCLRPDCPLSLKHGGDVIDAYQILYNLTFKQALAAMADELGF